MLKTVFRISPLWLLVVGVALVLFGGAGSRFSFGVFLEPLTDEFGWSRGAIAGALALAGLSTGFLRPIVGWLADRYDPVRLALGGVALGGIALFALSLVQELWQLYFLFLLLGAGFTIASPATLTKLISVMFTRRRALALSLAGSGAAVGETALVPVSAVVLTLSGWRTAYLVLSAVVLVVILPVSFWLLRRRNETVPEPGPDPDAMEIGNKRTGRVRCGWMPDQGLSLGAALKTPVFWALTAGYFT
jgi:MFS family permease